MFEMKILQQYFARFGLWNLWNKKEKANAFLSFIIMTSYKVIIKILSAFVVNLIQSLINPVLVFLN